MSRHRIAWVIWPLVALQIALITLRVILDALSRGSPSSSQHSLADILVGAASELVFPAVGALIFWRRPEHPIGWLFCLEDLGWSINNFAFAYATYALVTNPGALPAPQLIYWFYGWPGFVSVGLSLFLIFLFPNGRLLSDRWRPLAWLVVAWAVAGALGSAFAPGQVRVNPTLGIAIDNPAGITGPVGQLLDQIVVVAFFLVVPLFAAAAVALLLRQRRVQGQERQQLKWLTSAVGLVTVLYGVQATLLIYYGSQAAMPLWAYVLFQVSVLSGALIPIAAGLAILRYRLYDIDVLINRTLVYGALTASVVGIYALMVGYLGLLFQARGSPLIALLATGIVAVLFQPLRERLQRAVNRLVYGERDDPYAVLARLGRRLEATLAPDAVLPTIVQTVQEALRLPYAALAVQQPDGTFALRATAGTPTEVTLTLPLTHQSEQIGQLLLASRAAGEPFSPADRRLLADVARQAGVAAHAVRLTADLQHARQRLVTAREEERRRLRRDLHDGLGPVLASMALQADTARSLVRTDPDETEALLQELTMQAQATIGDIRRLIHGLRPPVLDDLGLAAALRALVASIEPGGVQIVIRVPECLPPLPAAVEVAAYRIAQEALTNVVRHARASVCQVDLTPGDTLHLRIADNGCGITAERRAGIGLTSMRERAIELGGLCVIEPLPGGGTCVCATLPLG